MGYDRRFAFAAFAAVLLLPALGEAQEGESCTVLCAPELKIEPTISFENIVSQARVERDGVVEQTQQETIFELIFAVAVSTPIERVSGDRIEGIGVTVKMTSL